MIARTTILLLCCFIYLVDVPAAMELCREELQEQSDCAKSCSKPMEDEPCSSEEKECEGTCTNCPMLYMATLENCFQLSPGYRIVKNQFITYDNLYTNDFFNNAWKPPNAG